MAKRLALLCVVLLLGFVGVMMTQQFPAWELLLSYGAKTDTTPVPSMKMGNHMQMSLKGKPQSGDERRAQDIIATAQQALAKYADVNTALRDGYKPFFPTGKVGEEVHYTNYRLGRWAGYDHPRSLLYRRTADGMQAVGVMYTAPQNATAEELAEIHAALVAGLANRTLVPIVGQELPLADAARAHEAVLEPGAFGKIVLVP